MSAFSRARRAEFGSYHHLGATWLDFYAGEICWRENWRRVNNKRVLEAAIAAALNQKVSRVLKGYWQHYLLPDNQLDRQEVRWGRVYRRVYQHGRLPNTEILVDVEREGQNPRRPRPPEAPEFPEVPALPYLPEEPLNRL